MREIHHLCLQLAWKATRQWCMEWSVLPDQRTSIHGSQVGWRWLLIGFFEDCRCNWSCCTNHHQATNQWRGMDGIQARSIINVRQGTSLQVSQLLRACREGRPRSLQQVFWPTKKPKSWNQQLAILEPQFQPNLESYLQSNGESLYTCGSTIPITTTSILAAFLGHFDTITVNFPNISQNKVTTIKITIETETTMLSFILFLYFTLVV